MSKQVTIYKVYRDYRGKYQLGAIEAVKTSKTYQLASREQAFGYAVVISHAEAAESLEKAFDDKLTQAKRIVEWQEIELNAARNDYETIEKFKTDYELERTKHGSL